MTNQVQLFAPLAGLIERTRKGLTRDTPMRTIAQKITSSGMDAFLDQIIQRYTGLSGAVFILSDTMNPTASTSIMYRHVRGETGTRHDNAMAILDKYGKANANLMTPSIRDLFNYSRKYQTRTVLGLPSRESFRIYIRIAKRFFIPDEDGTFPYTARETAGIICHEIGHTVWNVATADQILFGDTTFNQVVALIKSNPPVEETKKVLDLIYKDNLYPPSLKTVIEALRGMSVTDGSKDYQNFNEVAVWAVMATSAYTKKSTIDRFWYNPANRYTGANVKTSIERFCDSFAGQCGYGADLSTAFSKISTHLYSPEAIQRKMDVSYADAFLTAVLNPFDEIAWGKYDAIYDRMKDAVYATKQSLDNDALTKDQKTDILNAIHRGEMIYAEFTSRPYMQIRHTFYKIQVALGMVKTFTPSAFGSILTQTFADFHTALQTYNSGELAYLASLLETQ